ncbi:arsenic resistance protein [Alsobacter metallidurans]|uniref:arsenic resistance protein n=1 Tax=Alsobacter metallidurans TaxID=340221 RepID=UPI0027E4298B|nr:arsenic resistance protein [Alsobacter metallidurans]
MKIYFGTIIVAVLLSLVVPATTELEAGINPALALMLFVTFLQVPLADLGKALLRVRFLAALLIANFIAVPLLVLALIQFLPADPMVRLGVLFVLLTPCIDYVVTFAHIGRADAKLLLASTPALLVLQMLLLPVYLGLFLGDDAAALVQMGPFLHAFVWLIAIPLALAAVVQLGATRIPKVERVAAALGLLPVPATALVLFMVFASVVPQLGLAFDNAVRAVPIYIAFALAAPLIGWGIGRLAGLHAPAGRAIAFSAATRNSLVVLPLAFAVPNAMPLLPATIVAQTVVELISSLLYMRFIPKLGN